MTGTDSGLFTHNQSRSYLNHLVYHSRWTVVYELDDLPSCDYKAKFCTIDWKCMTNGRSYFDVCIVRCRVDCSMQFIHQNSLYFL
jgi:hypothetical protein